MRSSLRSALFLTVAGLASVPARAGGGAMPFFEPNQGQADPEALYLGRSKTLDLAITRDGALLRTRARGCEETLRLRVEGAAGAATVEGIEPLPGRTSYLRGSDPACWIVDLPRFARVRARGLKPGLDLVWHSTPDCTLEHDFVFAPALAPEELRLRSCGVG